MSRFSVGPYYCRDRGRSSSKWIARNAKNIRKKRKDPEEDSEDLGMEGEDLEGLEEVLRSKMDSLLNPYKESKGKKNHIYFDELIDKSSARELIGRIEELTIRIQKLTSDYDMAESPKIYLHINSLGGDLFSSLGISDYMTRNKVPIVTIVEGAAASGATMISLSGHERWITKNSYMMIHQLNGSCWGTFDQIEDEFMNKKGWMDRIIKIYADRSKMKPAELKNFLKHDLYWDSEECLKRGLVDKII